MVTRDLVLPPPLVCGVRGGGGGGAPLPGANFSTPAPVMLVRMGAIASSVFFCHEGIPQKASCSQYISSASPFYPQRRSMRWGWYLFFCYCVVALSRTRVRSLAIPCAKGLATYCSSVLSLLVAHTYQGIVVFLPKLTNAPTKMHTGSYIALCGSGVCLNLLCKI